jgi:hypothetical protein
MALPTKSAQLIELAATWLQTRGLSCLTLAEGELLDHLPCGTVPGKISPLSSDEVKTLQESAVDETIRASLIRWLCADRDAQALIDPGHGIAIERSLIVGEDVEWHKNGGVTRSVLDLCTLKIPFPLILRACLLPDWVLLLGAELSFLDFDASHVGTIEADVLKVNGDLYLRNGFTASGVVRLPGATIGGDFDCRGALLNNQDPPSIGILPNERGVVLNADGISVRGDVYLTVEETDELKSARDKRTFTASGRVSLNGAHIDGDLKANGGSFNKSEKNDSTGDALTFRGAVIGGNVAMGIGFWAKGAVRFLGATIGGNFDCTGAKFENRWNPQLPGSGIALELDGAEIKLDLVLSTARPEEEKIAGPRFADGTVSLLGTRVGRVFDCRYGAFDQANLAEDSPASPKWRPALDLRNAQVAYLRYADKYKKKNEDDAQKVRLLPGQLKLDGFVYGRISEGATDERGCLDWIDLQYETPPDKKTFRTQPYLQLAKVLREEGKSKDSRGVLFEMEKKRPRSHFGKIWGFVQRIIIGYGYRPWKAFIWLLYVALIGGLVFLCAGENSAMTPTNTEAYKDRSHYSTFQPFIYSLENSLPAIKFGQVDRWQPSPSRYRAPVCPLSSFYSRACWFFSPYVPPCMLNLIRVLQILAGWFLTTMAIAGLTGLVRRD